MSDVVTGEAVALDLRIAQLPARISAGLIDLVIMIVSYLLLGLIGGFTLSGVVDDALSAALYVLLIVGVFLGYPVIMESLTRGRTLGKMALGIRVIRADGGPITFRHALVRGLVGLILERPGFALVGFGPALAVYVCTLSKTGRRIGDMAAGTMVLQERVTIQPGWVPWMPAPLAGWASTLDLTGFDDSLALQIRQFLGRAQQFYPAAREQVGHLLADEVRQRTTPAPPPGTPGWAYLSAVLAERRHREEIRTAAATGRPSPPRPIWPPPWPPTPLPYAGGPPASPYPTHPGTLPMPSAAPTPPYPTHPGTLPVPSAPLLPTAPMPTSSAHPGTLPMQSAPRPSTAPPPYPAGPGGTLPAGGPGWTRATAPAAPYPGRSLPTPESPDGPFAPAGLAPTPPYGPGLLPMPGPPPGTLAAASPAPAPPTPALPASAAFAPDASAGTPPPAVPEPRPAASGPEPTSAPGQPPAASTDAAPPAPDPTGSPAPAPDPAAPTGFAPPI